MEEMTPVTALFGRVINLQKTLQTSTGQVTDCNIVFEPMYLIKTRRRLWRGRKQLLT